MSSKPKLLFVFDHPNPNWWMDGLSAALNVLENDFDIKKMNLATVARIPELGPGEHTLPNPLEYDFILGWGAFGSSVDKWIQANEKRVKSGLCIAGNATPPDGANSYDVLFYETKWYRSQISWHPHIVHAFGVNTDLYSPPTIPTPVVWDYIGVGAFASWKRWDKMADKPGCQLVVGEYQLNNESESLGIVRHLVRSGVMVSGQVSPLDLVNLYYWSRKLYMPADINGGGERAILEAKACGLPVEIEGDNPKLQELVDLDTVPNHLYYAAQLKRGIMSCLGKGHEEGSTSL